MFSCANPSLFASLAHKDLENFKIANEHLKVVLPLLLHHESMLDAQHELHGKGLHLTSDGVLVISREVWRHFDDGIKQLYRIAEDLGIGCYVNAIFHFRVRNLAGAEAPTKRLKDQRLNDEC